MRVHGRPAGPVPGSPVPAPVGSTADEPGRSAEGRSAGVGRHDERGAATAELAMALPVLVAVTIGLVWLLAVGIDQVRTVDAARETARAFARGDDAGAALARGREVGPDGTVVTVRRSGDDVVATATVQVHGPGGLFRFVPGVVLSARAVAAAEDSS